MSTTPNSDASPPPEPARRRQFGLGTLMLFVAACALYIAAFAWIPSTIGSRNSLSNIEWAQRVFLPIFVAWGVFFGLYRWWRIPGAVSILCAGPLTVLTVAVFFSPLALIEYGLHGGDCSDVFWGAPVLAATGCGFGVLVSFPSAILIMSVLAGREA